MINQGEEKDDLKFLCVTSLKSCNAFLLFLPNGGSGEE